jgi:hypothetical protein
MENIGNGVSQASIHMWKLRKGGRSGIEDLLERAVSFAGW